MTWVKLDDGFFTHPKAVAAGKDGRELYLAGLCYASANLTDGFIPTAAVAIVAAMAGVKVSVAARLVDIGLWKPEGDAYAIHDYAEHQRTRAQVLSERNAARTRKQRFMERQRNGVPNGRENGVRNGGRTTVEVEKDLLTFSEPPTPSTGGQAAAEVTMQAAATKLADAEAQRRSLEIGNPAGYVRARTPRILAEHEAVWRQMLDADPTLTADDLADGNRMSAATLRERAHADIARTLECTAAYVPPDKRPPIPPRPASLTRTPEDAA